MVRLRRLFQMSSGMPSEQVHRRAVGQVYNGARGVLRSARGYAIQTDHKIFGVGEDVVRKWLRRYERQGPHGLDDRPRRGRPGGPPGPADRGRRRATSRATTGWCRAAGPGSGCWRRSWGRACGGIARECPALPARQGRLALGAATPGPGDPWRGAASGGGPGHHAQAGAARAGGGLRPPPSCISMSPTLGLAPGDTGLLDEGAAPASTRTGQNAKRALFEALNTRTGQLHRGDRPRKQADQFVEFLDAHARPTRRGSSSWRSTMSSPTTPGWIRAWLAAEPSMPASASCGCRSTAR